MMSHEEIASAIAQVDIARGATCPLCGKAFPHRHTPEEIVIYRNGVKRGLYLSGGQEPTTTEGSET